MTDKPGNKPPDDKTITETKEPKPAKCLQQTFLPLAESLQRTFSPLSGVMSGISQGLVFPTPASYRFDLPTVDLTVTDTSFPDSYRTFENEFVLLRKRFEEQAEALREEKSSAKEKERKIAAFEATLGELRAKERIGFLLARVNQAAQWHLLASEAFRREFLETKECKAFVMSVDIRRSTELMLKARSPEDFATFITTLCADLMNIIKEHHGVFDKFTGDGVLAFFPDFYSGDDAAYYAVTAADKCHASFREHYQRFRRSFSSVLTEVGLGIGVDYGLVHLVQMAGGLTVVGAPVVYACRLSSAPANVTLANQPAYEVISDRFGAKCFINETTVEIKHEGGMLAYEVRLNDREYKPQLPGWRTEVVGAGGPDQRFEKEGEEG
jgi:class 3 adenylate cyclase